MNLKEAFRYQNFLTEMTESAISFLRNRENCVNITKTHNRSLADPDASDETEIIEKEVRFDADAVISFLDWCVQEKYTLSKAIDNEKKSLDFSIDAAIETNKTRRAAAEVLRYVLGCNASKYVTQGTGHRINNEGNQSPYVYDIMVLREPAYNKDETKGLMKTFNTDADLTSINIESALINSAVDYNPRFDVNDSFEDVMESFK